MTSSCLACSQDLTPLERLHAIKARSLPLLSSIPGYMCLETISRLEKGSRPRQRATDVLRVEVAVADRKEIYGWPQGARFSDQELAHMAGSGLTATGIYNGFARGLMSSPDDRFKPAGEGPLLDEAAFRYDFVIPARDGPWKLNWNGQTGIAGERGSLWADAKTLLLRRIEVSADGIPANLTLSLMHLVIDFEPVVISDRNTLLPATARLNAEDKNGMKDLSRIFFNHCRAFGSSSVLTFEGSDGADQSEKSHGAELPAGLQVSAVLESGVNLATAASGDPLEAVVKKAIFWKAKELVPAGAVLQGNIRRRRILQGSDHSAVTLEFDRLQTSTGWAQFYGRMTALTGISQAKSSHRLFDMAADQNGDEEIPNPKIPGVTTIHLPEGAKAIPAGTSMTWTIEDFSAEKTSAVPKLSTGIRTN